MSYKMMFILFDYELGLEWGDHLNAYPNTINILPFYLIILGFVVLSVYLLFHKKRRLNIDITNVLHG